MKVPPATASPTAILPIVKSTTRLTAVASSVVLLFRSGSVLGLAATEAVFVTGPSTFDANSTDNVIVADAALAKAPTVAVTVLVPLS